MVRFSIKPDDQTDETKSPNLVNKIGQAKREIVTKIFFQIMLNKVLESCKN